jgi:glycosyltransferase involved in cell wall biosynthesis
MAQKMRIMQITSGFPPYQLGGTNHLACFLATGLAKKRNLSVSVFSGGLGRKSREEYRDEQDNGFKTRRIKSFSWKFLETRMPVVNSQSYKNETVEKLFIEFAREVKPDIVHFQHTIGLSMSLIPLAREYARRTVVSLQDFWYICPRVHLLKPDDTVCQGPIFGRACYSCKGQLQRRRLRGLVINGLMVRPKDSLARRAREFVKTEIVERHRERKEERQYNMKAYLERYKYATEAISNADHILAPSTFLRDAYGRIGGIPESRICTIPLGVEPFQIEGKREVVKPIRFGYAGSPQRHKGVSLLFEVFSNIDPEEAQLVIWGTGWEKYFEALKKAKNIIFMGGYDRKTIGRVFPSFDILIVPSLCSETFSYIAHEALSVKMPVIASNIGVFPDIISPRVNGLLFGIGDLESLIGEIKWILDAPERLKMLSRNINEVKTDESFVNEVFNFYKRILNKDE